MPRSFHGRDTDALPTHPATANQTPAAHRLVARGALADVLSGAPQGGVLLVCAPAGSGKTELLRVVGRQRGPGDRVAWVSVERGEQDAQRFWLGVVDALAARRARRARGARRRRRPPFGGEAVVERLLSDLRALEQPVVLVIDDLHELRSRRRCGCSSSSSAACRRSCASCWPRARTPGSGCTACASPAG